MLDEIQFFNALPSLFPVVVLGLGILLCLGVLAADVLLLVRAGRVYREYFLSSMLSVVLALIPALFGLVLRAGDPQKAPYNFVPFTFFALLFFLPAGLMLMLMGGYAHYEERRDARAAEVARTRRVREPGPVYGEELRPGA